MGTQRQSVDVCDEEIMPKMAGPAALETSASGQRAPGFFQNFTAASLAAYAFEAGIVTKEEFRTYLKCQNYSSPWDHLA